MTAYLAFPDYVDELKEELGSVELEIGNLFLTNRPLQKVHWAQNIWLNPEFITFRSISDAAKQLRALQKLWALHPSSHFRRAELIQSQLSYFSPKPIVFPSLSPHAQLGSWTMIDANTLLASPQCTSPFAHGIINFCQSPIPPSRAYLKLWELMTHLSIRPKKGDVCLDLGASPGSWTWVLHELGTKVIAIDRAPLAPSIAELPFVKWFEKDAFSLDLSIGKEVDWVFCDVICYPEKLLEFVQKWLLAYPHLRFVCTIKFQKKWDPAIVSKFDLIENSRSFHLSANKHELMWCKL